MIYDRNIPNSSRRSGGREARRSLRAAPLARDLRPVRAGLEVGQTKSVRGCAKAQRKHSAKFISRPDVKRT